MSDAGEFYIRVYTADGQSELKKMADVAVTSFAKVKHSADDASRHVERAGGAFKRLGNNWAGGLLSYMGAERVLSFARSAASEFLKTAAATDEIASGFREMTTEWDRFKRAFGETVVGGVGTGGFAELLAPVTDIVEALNRQRRDWLTDTQAAAEAYMKSRGYAGPPMPTGGTWAVPGVPDLAFDDSEMRELAARIAALQVKQVLAAYLSRGPSLISAGTNPTAMDRAFGPGSKAMLQGYADLRRSGPGFGEMQPFDPSVIENTNLYAEALARVYENELAIVEQHGAYVEANIRMAEAAQINAEMTQLLTTAAAQYASQALVAAIMGEKVSAQMLRSALKALAGEALVKSVFELAEGWAAAATYRYDQAVMHWKAAGIYAAVGGAAALAGRAFGSESAAGMRSPGGRHRFGSAPVTEAADAEPPVVNVYIEGSLIGYDKSKEQVAREIAREIERQHAKSGKRSR